VPKQAGYHRLLQQVISTAFNCIVGNARISAQVRSDPGPALAASLLQQAHNKVQVALNAPACVQMCEASPGNEAAAAAAIEAATQAALAAAKQERQQVQLRLASLLCSCVKAVAREQQQQHCSWGWVATHCSSIARACGESAQLETAILDVQESHRLASNAHLAQKWRQVYKERVPLPDSLVVMLQHPYGSQLVELFNPVVLKLASDYSCQLKGEQLPAQIQPQHLNRGLRTLAAMLAYLPCMQDASSSSSSSDNAASSSSSSSVRRTVGSSTQQQGDSSSSSSSSGAAPLSGAELEAQLACAAVVARAVRLHSTVLDAAFSHPCLDASATDEARAAGAAQLKQQLQLAKKESSLWLFATLPSPLQQQFHSGDERFLSTADGAAAAIAAVLEDQEQQLGDMLKGIKGVHGMSMQLLHALQVPQDEQQQLHAAAVAVEAEMDNASQLWSIVLTRSIQSGANGRALWVIQGQQSFGKPLVAAMQRWADAVCAALPSRRCCSNPCCVVLREMSESNLVNGKACCCGGCAAAGQAVRYCGRDCQASHWQQHKALCRRRRRQQQQQQGQEQI
jgi:hypothetical protein